MRDGSVVAQFRQQAKNLEIEPHQRDEQAECTEPFHVRGHLVLLGPVNHVEVESQVERGKSGDEHAEQNAEARRTADERRGGTEDAEDHRGEVEDRDTHGEAHDGAAEAIRHLDDAGAVHEQHAEEHRGSDADSLQHDAAVLRVVRTTDRTEHDTFSDGIDRSEEA